MKEIAFYMTPVEMDYFWPIVKMLPKDIIDIHVGKLKGVTSDFYNLESEYQNKINEFKETGYSILPLNANALPNYRVAAMSTMFYGPGSNLFDWTKQFETKLVTLIHSTYIPLETTGFPPHYYILSSQREAIYPEILKYTRAHNAELFTKLTSFPKYAVNEYSWTGPYHLGDWIGRRIKYKSKLRSELENTLNSNLDPEKPVVAFMESYYNHPKQLEKGLCSLAPHVNLIVKNFTPMHIPGSYKWPGKSFAPNLMRFASDFILASYRSGTLVSSTMIGLPVIPYYTTLTSLDWFRRSKWGSYKVFMPGNNKKDDICIDILERLNPPVNIMDTNTILDRIYSQEWLETYNKALPKAQNLIFGDYDIDGAPAKAAKLLIRLVQKDSFGDDVVALRLRPEYFDSKSA